jgi:8-oxo-dGTP diphosphatase
VIEIRRLIWDEWNVAHIAKHDVTIHFVLVRRRDPAQVPRPMPPEITDWGFWSPDELPRPMSDFTVLRIRDALEPSDSILPRSVGPRRSLE